jgi:hypothetical protein
MSCNNSDGFSGKSYSESSLAESGQSKFYRVYMEPPIKWTFPISKYSTRAAEADQLKNGYTEQASRGKSAWGGSALIDGATYYPRLTWMCINQQDETLYQLKLCEDGTIRNIGIHPIYRINWLIPAIYVPYLFA